MTQKEAVIEEILRYARDNEWLFSTSKTNNVSDFGEYKVCDYDTWLDIRDALWVRFKKNGEAIQLRTK